LSALYFFFTDLSSKSSVLFRVPTHHALHGLAVLQMERLFVVLREQCPRFFPCDFLCHFSSLRKNLKAYGFTML
jgi:hypothetical protein